jgi:hypothetical protein
VSEIVRGQPPSVEDEIWEAAGKELTPLKILERIDSKAGFVFGNVTLVGTVLAGVGIASGAAGRSAEHPGAARLALGLLLASLLLALAANLPSFRTKINPEELISVRRFYVWNIRARGWLTRFALLFFAAALGLAAWLVFQSTGERAAPALTLQWRTEGETERGVLARVVARDLPPGAQAETALVSGGNGEADRVLARDLSLVDAAGNLAVTVDVGKAPLGTDLRLSVTVTDGGRDVASRSIELRP